MDFGDLSDNLPIIGTVIALILLQFFLRRRHNPQSSQAQIVQNLLSEVRVNLRLVDVLIDGEQIKRFIVTQWTINKNKLDFLDQSLQSALTDAFTIAEDYNQQVASYKKFRTALYIASINAGKMKEKLTQSKTEMEKWLIAKTGTKDPAGKSGYFDDLIGKV
jgi:hypothetical protein